LIEAVIGQRARFELTDNRCRSKRFPLFFARQFARHATQENIEKGPQLDD
jgi:hypothetical protein